MLRAKSKRKTASPYAHQGTRTKRTYQQITTSTTQDPSASCPSHTMASGSTATLVSSSAARSTPETSSTSGTASLATNVAISVSPLDNPIPLISVSDELGLHVPQTIKHKIWGKEYIELGKVLESELDSERGQKFSIVEGQLVMQPKSNTKKITSIDSWTDAFLVFASIYLSRHPADIQGILKYVQTIRLGASRNPTCAWLEYDKQFRLKMSKNTFIAWGSIDAELWLLYMSNHQISQPTQSTPKCYDYNYKGSCAKNPCLYQHVCMYCHKNHPRIHCWSNQTIASSNFRPNTPQTGQSNSQL
ncbi:uncharacterized protein LOC125657358 [Ostrea edulis]|uniref:uncharacterized protein LOC125657358 n=1 Tax=Ostrea edulis TaxID=37623 RepID=UPI0024AFF9FE|nr:uncharacterized protein LOC125657358 [Ostrea edulis]